MRSILVMCLVLTSCSVEPIPPVMDEFTIKIIHAPKLSTDGLAKWNTEEKTCFIYLKGLSKCEIHEYLHCRYGHWHGDKPNGDYCNVRLYRRFDNRGSVLNER